MAEARKKELEFFKGSKHYSDLKNVGTGFLSSKLSTHLINAIRKQLPVIQHSINDGIVGLDRELQSLGGPAVITRGQMVHLILQVCFPILLAPRHEWDDSFLSSQLRLPSVSTICTDLQHQAQVYPFPCHCQSTCQSTYGLGMMNEYARVHAAVPAL